jgi:hypothetical protein
MTSKNKKIVLGTSLVVAACGIGFLIYKRQVNKRNSGLMLEYISSLPNQIDTTRATEQGMTDVQNIKYDKNKLAISGMKGSFDNKNIKDAIIKTTKDLHSAIDGVGTKEADFYRALFNIKNKNTLMFINRLYSSYFKEGLFEAMKGEIALNSVIWAWKTPKDSWYNSIPFFNDGRWNPKLAEYFNSLPNY